MSLLPVLPFPFCYALAALDAKRVASAVLCKDTRSVHFKVSSSESLHLLVSFLKLSERDSVLKDQSNYCGALCKDWKCNWSWTWNEARWRVTFFGIAMRVGFWQDELCACLSAHFLLFCDQTVLHKSRKRLFRLEYKCFSTLKIQMAWNYILLVRIRLSSEPWQDCF